MSLRNSYLMLIFSVLFSLVLCGCGDTGANISSVTANLTSKLTGNGSTGTTPTPGVTDNSNTSQVGAIIGAGATAVQALTLNETAEPAMGQSVAAVVMSRYPLVDDNPKLTRYVSLVGLTVASVSAEPDANWCFGILDSKEINAFSGPDGYVMITRGAIAQMHDESELAGVLAHEITHVANHDGLHAAQAALKTKAVSQAASAANKRVAQFQAASDGAVDKIVVTGYDRGQEDRADAGAVALVVAAGYDPNGYLHFIERMALAKPEPGVTIMSTHPGLSDRVERIRAQITAMGASGGQTLSQRFTDNTK